MNDVFTSGLTIPLHTDRMKLADESERLLAALEQHLYQGQHRHVVGVLYLPGFAEFQPYDPTLADISMSSAELANYILTKFATVDEVREGLTKIRVVPVVEPALGGPPPLHWTVMDSTGEAIVIQYLKGELHIFDNPLRVLISIGSISYPIRREFAIFLWMRKSHKASRM